MTKKGDQYGQAGWSSALRSEVFEKVLRFAEEKIVRLTEEMASGEIDVRPYRLNQNVPCRYCKYKSVCRFDWQINDYQFLEFLNKSQALARIEGSDG